LGWEVGPVQTGLSLLLASLVEFGAAFGLFLAMLPLRGHRWFERTSMRGHPAAELLKPVSLPREGGQGAKRLARSADGQLMIEMGRP
jgi:hypothetical protein